MLATRENMRRLQERRDIFAYSRQTGERYSATPGDYFWLPDGMPLTDADGGLMILAREESRVIPIFEIEASA